jgi:TrmH family RNA methyltransferase
VEAPADYDITSTSNPRVKALVRLRRRRYRTAEERTLVEGFEELRLAVSAGARPSAVYHCPDLARPGELAELRERPGFGAAELLLVSPSVFGKISYRDSPDGWLAVLPSVRTELAELRLPGEDPLLLVCEGVEKPGNLGAMLRTADAAGVAAVIATDPGTDWANPNVVRASKGAVHALPVAAASGADALRWLAERGIAVVAATPEGGVPYTELDLRGPLAIAVGAEKDGLSGPWLAAARDRALIPMHGLVDSLNVSTSAAILLFEALRQRNSAQ